jgi:hypothetical protein
MSRRALIIGIVAVLVIGAGTPYADLVMRGTWVGLTAFPISALFVLIAVVGGLNTLMRRLGKGLSTAELLLVYCMSLVAGGIPSFGLTGLLIPYIAGPYYFATPENKYAQILHPYIPKWFHPASQDAVTKLYEGLREGEAIPWGQWLVPLAVWTLLAFIVYAAFFCLSTILRKRWIDDEKLVFPLLQLPIEMTSYGGDKRAVAPFFRNRTMWIFFAVPFLIHTVNGLHYYLPAVPTINVNMVNLGQYMTGKPWTALSPFWMRGLFSIVGLAYLLPSELSFSLWVFYFFFMVQAVLGEALGMPMPTVQAYGTKEFISHQMWGGIIMSGVLGLVAARPRLEEVFGKALGRRPDVRDDGEPLPYSFAVKGLIVAIIGLGIWGAAAGAQFSAVVIIFALYFLVHIVAVRLVCEGGMLYVQHPFRPLNMMLHAVGSRNLGPRNLAILGYLDHLWMVDNRSPLMPGIMQSLRLADSGPLPRRPLARALALAIVLAVLSSYVSYLRLMYQYGGSTLHQWFTAYYTRNLYCTWIGQLISVGEPAKPMAFLTMGIGAATMWALTWLHHTFLWWPLHPIGYLMGASWPMINFWFPVFVGWMFKTVILRVAGPKVYRNLVPGFLGLVLAEFSAAGLWVLVDFCAGVRGHEIFSF